MTDVPQWVWPLLTLASSALGSWAAVKISVARLEVQVSRALEDIKYSRRELDQHNEDLLVHDMEIEDILSNLKIPRKRRQPLRGWER